MRKVAIHSVPRSGSTWLGNIFNSHPDVCFRFQPLFSYSFKGYLAEDSSEESINSFFHEIKVSTDPFINQTENIRKGRIPDFFKSESPTHICYKEVRYHHILRNLLDKDKEVRVIALVRNPFSTLNSWLNAPREFRADLGWKVEEEWKTASKKNLYKPEEYNGFERWKEATQLFLFLKNTYPDRFYLLKYDDLLADPEGEVSKLFKFSALEVSEQTFFFLKESTKNNDPDAYSVFKSKMADDQWLTGLPGFIIEQIRQDAEFITLNNTFHWI